MSVQPGTDDPKSADNPFWVRDGDVCWQNTYLHQTAAERLLEALSADPEPHMQRRAEQLRVVLHTVAQIHFERDAA